MGAFASRYWVLGVLAAVLALPAAPAGAENVVDAMAAAYNTNPDLGAQRARLRQADENVAQAISNWRPTIRIIGEYGRSWFKNNTTLLDWQRLRPYGAQAQIVQPIFRGGRTLAETRASEQDVLAERAALLSQEQQVLLDAVTAYADVVTAGALVGLRANNVRVLREDLTSTTARFRVGELTRTDVSQAEARLAGSQSDLIAAEAELAVVRAVYLQVVGIPPGTLAEPMVMGTLPKTEEEAIALAGERHPSVRAAFHREASARYRVDLAIGELLPTVSIIGTTSKFWDSNIEGDRSTRHEIIGQVSIPIYQGGAEHSRVREAKQFVGQRRLELDSVRRAAIEQTTRVWQRLEAQQARVKSIKSQIDASALALDGVRQEALVGTRTTLDVLDAEQELLDAKVLLVRAERDVVVQHYSVLAAIGALLARELKLPVQLYDEEEYYRENRNRWIGLGPSIDK
ncbi:MAG: TolC family outer membrane protein [Reyranellaceae bacterium]